MIFTWNLDPELISIGPLTIRYYGVIFVLMFALATRVLHWQLVRGGHGEQAAMDFVFLGVLAVIIGARLGHCLFYDPAYYLKNPLQMLKIWKGGLASHGATIGLFVVCAWFAYRRKFGMIEMWDRFAFPASVGAAMVRLGNFFNSEIVGRVTDQSWGVRFPRFDKALVEPPLRHPSQLYEFMLGAGVFFLLWLVDRAAGREKRPVGLLVSCFCIFYFGGRFFVEYYKEYQSLDPTSTLTMGQYLSIPFVVLGIGGVILSLKLKRSQWEYTGPRLEALAAPAKKSRKKKKK